jgi:ribose 5-phosphate isomerase B
MSLKKESGEKDMIYIGSDHGGFELKEKIIAKFSDKDFIDCGVFSNASCDYPDIAKSLCKKVLEEPDNLGILICGTGIGMTISANKINGIRAARVSDRFSAKMAREHNNANVICLGERTTLPTDACDYVKIFLETKFLGDERHVRRVE